MPSQIVRALLKAVAGLALGCLLLAWWTVIAAWYIVVGVLFGLFLPMFRAFRRSDRKRKVEELRHREMLRAVQQGSIDVGSLESERVVIQSPMSFRGAYLRIMKLARLLSEK